jgi:hypothetical protein
MSRGNSTENRVAQVLRDAGYMVASRRHEPGPGDLLAWRVMLTWAGSFLPPLLVEVKGTLDPPWRSTWGAARRREMLEAKITHGVEPILAWWPPYLRGGPIWLPPEDWPKAYSSLALQGSAATQASLP